MMKDSALLTDLYELTMAQSYFDQRMAETATFSLFVRRLPHDRGYMVAAGLDDVLRYLEEFRFSDEDVAYLRSTGIFSDKFLHALPDLRFTGDVRALPEGSLFFPNEPVLEVTAPIIEAQAVESYIINQVNLQSMIAAKAARCVIVGRGTNIVDFSLRRTHGTDAGMKVARASYLAGFNGTSNVLAGKEYGIPIVGTMAHSYVTAFERETDSFRAYTQSFPDRSILLIDTYDTPDGARKAAQVAKELETRGHRLAGVRLDSGDLGALSREVRGILDEAGLGYVRIVASGGLDEYDIEELLDSGAPIDGFGVGTKMGVSADAPWLDIAYKLVRYGDRPVLKLSQEKVSLPDAKQVYRIRDAEGFFQRDILALRDETVHGGEPLLAEVMRDGQRTGLYPSLAAIRARLREELAHLPNAYKTLRGAPAYPVETSEGLRDLALEVTEEIEEASRMELRQT
jgi:nicotinate phosphoribosyltransferase